MYEGGLLVPACAEWPGAIEPASQTDVRVSTIDFFPTIAGLVDHSFSASQARPIDGIDLMPVIDRSVTARNKDLFFGFRRLHDGTDGKAIIRGDHKLMKEAKKNGATHRYDLCTDPYEQNDLADSMPDLFQNRSDGLQALEASCQLSRDDADNGY